MKPVLGLPPFRLPASEQLHAEDPAVHEPSLREAADEDLALWLAEEEHVEVTALLREADVLRRRRDLALVEADAVEGVLREEFREAVRALEVDVDLIAHLCRTVVNGYQACISLTQQLDRLFASMGTYTMNEIKRPGELNLAQWKAVHDQLKQLGKYRFDLDTRGGLTPAAVQSKAMMLQAQRGLDLIIIDHIQLMASDHHYTERTAEVTEISGRLKQVAMKLHVPILALSQLSRAVEGRGDKVPQLSDLRESGSIEQDADVVMLLWRDSYYSKNSSDRKASLILGKVREGRTGEIPLTWFPQFAKFSNGTWGE